MHYLNKYSMDCIMQWQYNWIVQLVWYGWTEWRLSIVCLSELNYVHASWNANFLFRSLFYRHEKKIHCLKGEAIHVGCLFCWLNLVRQLGQLGMLQNHPCWVFPALCVWQVGPHSSQTLPSCRPTVQWVIVLARIHVARIIPRPRQGILIWLDVSVIVIKANWRNR